MAPTSLHSVLKFSKMFIFFIVKRVTFGIWVIQNWASSKVLLRMIYIRLMFPYALFQFFNLSNVEKITVVANGEIKDRFTVTAQKALIVPTHHFVFRFESKT